MLLKNKLQKEARLKAYKERLKALRIRRAEEAAKQERKKQERDAAKAIQSTQSGKRKALNKPQKKP